MNKYIASLTFRRVHDPGIILKADTSIYRKHIVVKNAGI